MKTGFEKVTTRSAGLQSKGGSCYWAGCLAGAFLSFAGEVAADDAAFVLPSGLVAHLQEVITDAASGAAATYRYRFVSPDFTNAGGLELVTADLEHLCMVRALPELDAAKAETARIIVSLADAPSEFGVSNPDITQVFEAFRVEDDRCIWEVF